MEMRKVNAWEQVLRNLSSKEHRDSTTGSKHWKRESLRNWPISKGMIVRCYIGDQESDMINRVKVNGSSQGIVFRSLCGLSLSSNLVIHGEIAAAVVLDLPSHGLTSVGASVMCRKSFF